MCCVCNGTCNHVGNHSFCAAHGGSPNISPPYFTYTTTTTNPFTSLSDEDVERIADRVAEKLSKKKKLRK